MQAGIRPACRVVMNQVKDVKVKRKLDFNPLESVK